MKKLAVSIASGVALILTFASCSSLPEDQRAYDACTKYHNSEFRFKPGPKAIVAGVSGSSTHCFWNWSQESTASAVSNAMSACEAKYARCFVYATGNGNSDWVQAISDNGGESAGAQRARASNDATTSILSGIVAGTAAGIVAGSGGYQSQPTYGGYTPSPPRSTYGSRSDCVRDPRDPPGTTSCATR